MDRSLPQKRTRDLAQIMLRDSAHIQMFEAEWRNRKGRRAGKAEVLPLYDMNDAEGAIQCLVGLPYEKEYHVNENVKIRFLDAGISSDLPPLKFG